jgi:Acetyltransferases
MELKKVTNQNLWDVVNLKVKSDQKEYVADNATSLLEAYATQNEGEKVETFAVYEKDNLVGFAMINFNVCNWEGAPKVARNNYCLWRFMIDQKYQDQGLGRAALNKIIDYAKTNPLGKGRQMYLSYVPGNTYAEKLYRDFGFVANGEKDEEEIVLVLDLEK